MPNYKIKDLTGKQFGSLTAVRPLKERQNGSVVWECVCACGKTTKVRSGDLTYGSIQSCGCSKRFHGMYRTPAHRSWQRMLNRCRNPNYEKYKYYGGRGIKVCSRWYEFSNFFIDMGERPQGLTLERINNDGNYEPKNCKWATMKEQANNTSILKLFIGYGPCGQIEIAKNQSIFARKWGLLRKGISNCLNCCSKTHAGWKFEFLKPLAGIS